MSLPVKAGKLFLYVKIYIKKPPTNMGGFKTIQDRSKLAYIFLIR